MENLTCIVCLSRASLPKLCPTCKKLICSECLDHSFATMAIPGCPHCRAAISAKEFLAVPWLDELITLVPSTDLCELHLSKRITLYCTCGDLLCPDCWVDHNKDSKRKRHLIQPIEVEYGRCLERLAQVKARAESIVETGSIFTRYKQEVEKEGQILIEEYLQRTTANCNHMRSLMTSVLKKKLDAYLEPAQDILDIVKDQMEILGKVNEVEKTPMMNQSIQKCKSLVNDDKIRVGTTLRTNGLTKEAMKSYPNGLDHFGALDFLNQWLPGWDFKEIIDNIDNFNFTCPATSSNWTVYAILHHIYIRQGSKEWAEDGEALEIVVESLGEKKIRLSKRTHCDQMKHEFFLAGSEWRDGDGNLTFRLKVRPLDYARRCSLLAKRVKTLNDNLDVLRPLCTHIDISND